MCVLVFGDLSFFFFFKQKTAYEMRISDWSSDVCSSDLLERIPVGGLDQPFRPDRILVELIDVSTVEEVLAPAVALDRHEGGNVRCNVVGQTSCQICLPRDGVIICISKIEVPAEVVAGILRADADDTTGRIRSEERRVGKECVSTCRYGWWTDH